MIELKVDFVGKSGYLRYVELPNEGLKTSVFAVNSVNHGNQLGTIRWYGAWRQYVFYPDPVTLFNPTCLKEIAEFCSDLSSHHKILKLPQARE